MKANLNDIHPCDILLARGNGIGAAGIRLWSGSYYNHGAFVFPSGLHGERNSLSLIHSQIKEGVHEENFYLYIRKSHIVDWAVMRIVDPHTQQEITVEQGEQLLECARKFIGAKYDTKGILGFLRLLTHWLFQFIPLKNPFQDEAKFFCFEFVRDMAIKALGIDICPGRPFGLEDASCFKEPSVKYIMGS